MKKGVRIEFRKEFHDGFIDMWSKVIVAQSISHAMNADFDPYIVAEMMDHFQPPVEEALRKMFQHLEGSQAAFMELTPMTTTR